jgi:putative resolvase
MEGYLPRGKASKALNIHYHTLTKLAKNNEIETIKIGEQHLYNVKKFLELKGIYKNANKRNICYCRVSSYKQKADLDRQIEYMKKEYPYHEIITDIASGLNYERDGLKKIIRYALKGEINEVVIAYKDRLTRFGYELIEWLIKDNSNGTIKIINNNEETTPMEEISKDIITIMNVYVAKVNGLRKYKKQIKIELNENINK